MPYEYINKIIYLNNLRYVLNELKKIRNLYFKDIEKRLINNLIEYIAWKSTTRDNVRLRTLKFENYWEIMINEYLNDGFCGIEEDKIIWGENKQNKFSKPEMEYVESVEKRLQYRDRSLYKIQYDHIFIDDDNHKIILFDSKYFNAEVDQLNYKQLFYQYNLRQKYPEFLIYNGLLLSTEKTTIQKFMWIELI